MADGEWCVFDEDCDFYINTAEFLTGEGPAYVILCLGRDLVATHVYQGFESDMVTYLREQQDAGKKVPEHIFQRLEKGNGTA